MNPTTFAPALAAAITLALAVNACGGIVAPGEDATDGGASNATSSFDPTDAEAVGAPCVTDGDCHDGLTCFQQHNEIALPNGYCSKRCTSSAECPNGSVVCGSSVYDLGLTATCMPTCNDRAMCRQGYVCTQVQTPTHQRVNACWTTDN